jgi:hypothetical protein
MLSAILSALAKTRGAVISSNALSSEPLFQSRPCCNARISASLCSAFEGSCLPICDYSRVRLPWFVPTMLLNRGDKVFKDVLKANENTSKRFFDHSLISDIIPISGGDCFKVIQ